jgi:predicted ester cyclase
MHGNPMRGLHSRVFSFVAESCGLLHDPVMALAHRTLVQRWFAEVWNQKREAAIHEMLHPEVRIYGLGPNPDEAIQGPAAFVPFWKSLVSAVPDIQVTVEAAIAEDDRLAARCTVRGTHSGPGLGVAPAGARIQFSGILFVRVKDEKFIDGWNSFDFLRFYQQIGLIKLPA